jgi:hypothetical protein
MNFQLPKTASIAVFLLSGILSSFIGWGRQSLPSSTSASAALPTPLSSAEPIATTPFPAVTIPNINPQIADNTPSFPSTSGYIEGYPEEFTDGYSTLTIDNTQGSADVFVKLYSMSIQPPRAVSHIFVRSGESFTVENIRAGTYQVRYRNLDTGSLTRSESFSLEETQSAAGIRFSRMTLTLYTVPNGNTQMHPISPDEF